MKLEIRERIKNKKMQLWEKLGEINLLIVDDDSFSRILVENLLNKIPQFNFLEAKDGIEALDVIQANQIDIVLLDLHMPNMNGFQLIKVLRNEDKYKELPILVMSVDKKKEEELCDGTIDGFVYKPFKLEELRSKIYKVLSKKIEV